MITTQYINLNMIPSGVMPVLYCSQYDIGRPLGMVVYNGGEAVDLDSYTCTIEATRTDGTAIIAAVTTDDNIGAFVTTATMTNQADKYQAKLVLFDSNSRRVASLAFVMCVTVATMDENAESIEEDASLYQQYTGTVQALIADIRTQLNAEASARQAADNQLQSNINAEASARATQDNVLQAEIDQLVAPSGSAPSAAEVTNARIGADGTTYDTLGNAIRGQVTDVKSAINHGTYNYLNSLEDTTTTHNGITWSITNREIYAAPGTSTDTSFVRLYYDTANLLDDIIPGETYTAYFITTNNDIALNILYYVNGSLIEENVYAKWTKTFTVPNGVTGMQVRVEVPSGVTLNTVEHAVVKILQFPSNVELGNNIDVCENNIIETKHAVNNSNLDLLPRINRATAIHNGITYDFVGDDEIIANGTANGVSSYSIFFDKLSLLDGVEAGEQYFIAYSSSDSNLRIQVSFYKNEVDYKDVYATADRFLSVPNDAEGMKFALYVADGVTLTNATVTKIGLLKAPDNEYISAKLDTAYLPYNRLDNDVDPNTLTENGIWLVYKGNTNHNPFNGTINYILEVAHPFAGACVQKAVTVDGTAIKFRTLYTNTWSLWSGVFNDSLKISYSDLTVGTMIKLDREEVYFRPATMRLIPEQNNWASKIIPVKKGDYIYLYTKAGSNAGKPYAIIKNDLLISYTYTSGANFDGFISIEEDGFLAVNTQVQYSDTFKCTIYRSDIEEDVRTLLFSDPIRDRLDVSYNYKSDNPCSVLKVGPSMAAAIHHWGIVGASYDSGTLNFMNANDTQAGLDYYEYSWGQCFKRMNNIPDLYNYTNGGQHTKDWLTKTSSESRGHAFTTDEDVWLSYYDGNPLYPNYGGHGPGGGCWWKMKADHENGDTKQAFVVVLGSNDIGIRHPHDENWNTLEDYDQTLYYEEGTIEDIGTYDLATDTDTPPVGKTAGDVPGIVNSYAGYMGAILNRLIAIQPRCVIFLATIRNNYGQNPRSLEIWNKYNAVLRQIVEMNQFKDNCILIDYGKYGPNYYGSIAMSDMKYGHPNAFGYQIAAFYYNTLIDSAIMDNLNKIPNPTWIGTNRSHPRR